MRHMGMKHLAMFTMLISIMALAIFAGCGGAGVSGVTVNGEIDDVEASYIRLAVGVTLSARPEMILPAYTVSTALLAADSLPGDLDDMIQAKAAENGLQAAEATALIELSAAITAQVKARIDPTRIDNVEEFCRRIIQIVHDAAAARLPSAAGGSVV